METLLNDFSPGLFVMQTVLLIVLILLMVKFAWKPILNSLNEREEGIQGALDAAEKAKLEMANLQADNERLLQEARTERESMLKEAREMKATVATLSLEIAEKVVKSELSNSDKQMKLVNEMLSDAKLN